MMWPTINFTSSSSSSSSSNFFVGSSDATSGNIFSMSTSSALSSDLGSDDNFSHLAYPAFCATLQEVGRTYNKMHGGASIAVCLFGTVANILNFMILTRKEMVNSTNLVLTGLAVSDLLNLIEYVPYAIYTDFLPDGDGGPRKTYPWAVYVWIHSNFSQVCHTISIWLTVTIAAWRYFMISMPLQSRALCSMYRAKLIIALAYCITPILCAPIYFTFSVQSVRLNQTIASHNSTMAFDSTTKFPTMATFPQHFHPNSINNNNMSVTTSLAANLTETTQETIKYIVSMSNFSNQHPSLFKANFWIYSVVLKLIPCLLLSVVSGGLIKSLIKAKHRKEKLLGPLSTAAEAAAAATAHANITLEPPSPKSNKPSTSSQNASPGAKSLFVEHIPLENLQPPPQHQHQNACSSNSLTPHYSGETSSVSCGVGEIQADPESENASSIEPHPVVLPSSQRASSSLSTSGGGGDIYLTTRTTRMLLTVLILFLITEFPQGILALCSAIMGPEFFKRCYIPMANLMDFLALLNCSINFILYCFMSKRFRDAFCRMVSPAFK